jgi:predicted enzyme related to lactoylglutathione lyase
MSIDNAIASVAVTELRTAAAWYEKLFGRPPDSSPMPEVREWKFERGGWLQVYQLAERAGSGSFTLAVSNLDDEVRKLRAMGVDTSNRSSGSMTTVVMITDPDGNHIALAETTDASMAR